MKKFVLCSAVALALAVPAIAVAQDDTAPAAETVVVKKGYALFDNAGKKLGRVEQVRSDGYVTFFRESKIYRVPLSSLTVEGRTAKTSLTWAEIRG